MSVHKQYRRKMASKKKKNKEEKKARVPKGWEKGQGYLARISPEERKKLAAKGGRISRRGPEYKRCDECKSADTCPDFEDGGRCAIQKRIRKLAVKPPSKVFAEMGFGDSKDFFEQLSKDMAYIKECILLEKGPNANKMMSYIDRLTAMAKLMYGEKHLNVNLNANAKNVLDIEKLVSDKRKSSSYNPKTGEVGEE